MKSQSPETYTGYLCLHFLRSLSLWHESEQDWSFDGRWQRLAARRCFVDQVLREEIVQPVLARRGAGRLELLRLVRRLSSEKGLVDLALETVSHPEALDLALGHGLGQVGIDSQGVRAVAAWLKSYFERLHSPLVPLSCFLPSTEAGAEAPVVEWYEVRGIANQAFNVWTSDYQFSLAREAWSILEAQGLTTYSDATSRARVYVRMLALGDLYRDFCQIAADEINDFDAWSFAAEVGVDKTVLCPEQIAALDGQEVEDESEDEELIDPVGIAERLQAIVDGERSLICRALVEGYGSEMVLLGSLNLTLLPDQQYQDRPGYRSFEDAICDVTNQASYDWVEDGCPVLGKPFQGDY